MHLCRILIGALDALLLVCTVLVFESSHARRCNRDVVLWGLNVGSGDRLADIFICLFVLLMLVQLADKGCHVETKQSTWFYSFVSGMLYRVSNCISSLYYHTILALYILPYYVLVRTGALPMCSYSVILLFTCCNTSLRIVQYCSR